MKLQHKRISLEAENDNLYCAIRVWQGNHIINVELKCSEMDTFNNFIDELLNLFSGLWSLNYTRYTIGCALPEHVTVRWCRQYVLSRWVRVASTIRVAKIWGQKFGQQGAFCFDGWGPDDLPIQRFEIQVIFWTNEAFQPRGIGRPTLFSPYFTTLLFYFAQTCKFCFFFQHITHHSI